MTKRIFLAALLICLVFGTAAAQRARDHIAQGREHLQAQRFEQAIESFQAALALEPRNRDAPALLQQAQEGRTTQLFNEAERLRRESNFEEAVAMYDRAAASAPSGYNTRPITDAKAATLREKTEHIFAEAQRLRQAGNITEALAMYDMAVQSAPHGYNTRQITDARAAMLRERTDSLFAEAQRLRQAGDIDEASAMYDSAAQSAPQGYNTRQITDAKAAMFKERTDRLFAEAQRLRQTGNIDEASAMYDTAVQSAPQGYNTRQITDAKAAMFRERTDRIVAEADRLQRENKFDEAIAMYKQAIESAPSGYNTQNIQNRIAGIERTRLTAQSDAAFQAAIEFLAAGNYSEALIQFENVVKIGVSGGNQEEAGRAITVLKGLPDKQASYNRPLREDDFDIRQIQNGVEIANYKACETLWIDVNSRSYKIIIGIKNVVIPNRLYNLPVTQIGDGAFRDKNLTSVTIPNTIILIGAEAFSENKNLTTIVIPNSVTEIGYQAFKSCGLTSFTLGNGVRDIAVGMFSNNMLTSITIPASVRKVDGDAFIGNQITSVTIPNGVTELLGGSFYENPLTTVVIPASITWINNAFPNTLTRVTLPANINDLSMKSFEEALSNFYIGQGRRAGVYVKNGPVWSRQ